jgi:chromatin remodeling complex protein RSC6
MAKTNSAFMKPMNLSAELEEVVGKGPMPRSEVTSKIWIYIKDHKLQDAKDGRIINADAKLQKVSGGVASFNMMKLAGFISKHVS